LRRANSRRNRRIAPLRLTFPTAPTFSIFTILPKQRVFKRFFSFRNAVRRGAVLLSLFKKGV
jgi:hypothetical protein